MNVNILLQKFKHHRRYIRDHWVIIDKEAADFYGVSARYLRWAVSSNLKRFPKDAAFKIKPQEWQAEGYLPYVFTQEGMLLLSNIIRNPIADRISVEIVRE